MSGTILVAYGTKHGSTREVAHAVAETLEEHGLDVDTLPAARVDDLSPYAGVVVGGAIYMGRWHPDAVGFLEQHRKALAVMPVAVFGMGPRTMEDHDARSRERSSPRRWRRCPRSTRTPLPSSAASSTLVPSGSRSTACRPAMRATGTRSGPGRPTSPGRSTAGKPHQKRGIPAASFSRRPDEQWAPRGKACVTRSELEEEDSAATQGSLRCAR